MSVTSLIEQLEELDRRAEAMIMKGATIKEAQDWHGYNSRKLTLKSLPNI